MPRSHQQPSVGNSRSSQVLPLSAMNAIEIHVAERLALAGNIVLETLEALR